MKKIVILGCENSHADGFLEYIKKCQEFSDVEVIGVYSDEPKASERLHERYGVPVMQSYDEAVGKVDGVIITARHGGRHYPFAKPYIASGVPMFIDKPITISEEEAVAFMRELRDANIKITGGSSLKHADVIKDLKEKAEKLEEGKTIGGALRSPFETENIYGGVYFYAQHLVEMLCEVFGRYPKSVRTCSVDKTKTVIFRYDNYDVTGVYCDETFSYYAVRFSEKGSQGGVVDISDGKVFYCEFAEFYKLLCGGEQQIDYKDFISPVFIMTAFARSLLSGEEEAVREFSL